MTGRKTKKETTVKKVTKKKAVKKLEIKPAAKKKTTKKTVAKKTIAKKTVVKETAVQSAGPHEMFAMVQALAYEFFQERGGGHGADSSDWSRAEELVKSKYAVK
jgi:Protein of unknown function (DUF2934)